MTNKNYTEYPDKNNIRLVVSSQIIHQNPVEKNFFRNLLAFLDIFTLHPIPSHDYSLTAGFFKVFINIEPH